MYIWNMYIWNIPAANMLPVPHKRLKNGITIPILKITNLHKSIPFFINVMQRPRLILFGQSIKLDTSGELCDGGEDYGNTDYFKSI